jgi:hypothetical protein
MRVQERGRRIAGGREPDESRVFICKKSRTLRILQDLGTEIWQICESHEEGQGSRECC